MKIALGSDERTTLTNHITRYLQGQGHTVELVGALKEGDEKLWPHVGYTVARLVLDGSCDTGIASCWTRHRRLHRRQQGPRGTGCPVLGCSHRQGSTSVGRRQYPGPEPALHLRSSIRRDCQRLAGPGFRYRAGPGGPKGHTDDERGRKPGVPIGRIEASALKDI